MSANGERRLLLVWLALVAVTLVSWWIGSSHGDGEFRSNALITYGVLLIAAIKIRVIVREFMEVRHAPHSLRRLTDGWTVFVIAALLAIYSLKLSMPPV
jgi:apolipoprotein N-acyltransferase